MIGEVEPDRSGRAEDGFARGGAGHGQPPGVPAFAGTTGEAPVDYLKLLRDAEQRGTRYVTENLKAAWEASLRAFRNKHFGGSKYYHADYRNRSKLFRPKTRNAVRKANAAAIASLFATADAVKFSAGDESNPDQAAAAALLREVVNYRTDRASGVASMPWFRICGGAHQDAMIQSACVSKQSWKLELRKVGEREGVHPETDAPVIEELHEPFVDRPDCQLIPLENVVLDPAASWLDPIQSAAFAIFKYPMSVDEVMQMAEHPLNPWHRLEESVLRSVASTTEATAQATRRNREGGIDRLDSRFSGGNRSFEIVWVYEVFIRWRGVDITFWSARDRAFLTDPKPVGEVYPEQGGERPYTMGVVNLESHRLFPMAPVESWQQSQIEINDFANLMLDTAKLSVAPVSKVVRGRNVDLAALARRGPNAQILVESPEDVSWDKPPGVGSDAMAIMERLNNDFDTSAGQFDQSSVQASRYTGETVGGLQLIAGSANAVTEFDLRVWIETWVEPTLAQIVRLIQWYESDAVILGLCGRRAQLFEKHGVGVIDDRLLQQEVKVRIDAGVGNADPAQRLQKLGGAVGMVMPVLANNPDVASGAVKLNLKGFADEVFGLAGYRDGADKFLIFGAPNGPNPMQNMQAAKLQAEIDKSRKQGDASMIAALASAAKVKLGHAQLEADKTHALVDAHFKAADLGHSHALAIRGQTHHEANGVADAGSAAANPAFAEAPADQSDMLAQLIALLREPRTRRMHIVRGADGRIADVIEVSQAQRDQEPKALPPAPTPDQPTTPPLGGLAV